MKYIIPVCLFILLSGTAWGQIQQTSNPDLNYAQVKSVRIEKSARGTYAFHVTVRHNDEGWDHYADLWQVIDTVTGTILGERVLLHPHENEQPFTRSQSGIVIPDGTAAITVRAKCTKHGYEGKQVKIDLTLDSGEDYSIKK